MFNLNQVTLRGNGRLRLNNVSLTIPSGRTALIGFSGAGKTSLLNLLAGFEFPDPGSITSTSMAVQETTASCSSNTVPGLSAGRIPLFWVPQNGGLWPHLSAEQHLHSVNKSKELADEILACLDLAHRRAAVPDELSQGERSRLSLARALASNAEVLLMDEPLSHVDPVRKPGYWDVMNRLIERSASSIVFSSHEPETVLRQSDSVICLHEGEVVFQGATREFYESPSSQFLAEFLGPVNWFTAEEQQHFGISIDRPNGMPIRPERLSVVANGKGEAEYVKCLFDATYSESLIRSLVSGTSRIIKHQRLEVPLQEGVRVSLVRR